MLPTTSLVYIVYPYFGPGIFTCTPAVLFTWPMVFMLVIWTSCINPPCMWVRIQIGIWITTVYTRHPNMDFFKMQQRLFTILVLTMVFFAKSAKSRCSTLKRHERDFEDCWILFKEFQYGLVDQYNSNLFQLDQVFNPLSRIVPTIVKVKYRMNLTLDGCNL